MGVMVISGRFDISEGSGAFEGVEGAWGRRGLGRSLGCDFHCEIKVTGVYWEISQELITTKDLSQNACIK